MYIYTYKQTHMYICTYMHICIYAYAYIYIYSLNITHLSIGLYCLAFSLSLCSQTTLYIDIHPYISIYIHICIQLYIHIYIHINIYTYKVVDMRFVFICLSVCLSLCRSVCLSLYLSVSVSFCILVHRQDTLGAEQTMIMKHCVAVLCNVLQHVALCCDMLQCVAVCCARVDESTMIHFIDIRRMQRSPLLYSN